MPASPLANISSKIREKIKIMNPVIELTAQLVARESITPKDADCQKILCARLQKAGFHIEPLPFGEVTNFWAVRGDTGPLLAFAGHTDVVPPGPLSDWSSPPFTPEIRGGYLYGRGAADMKGGLAAMLTATEQFVLANPNHSGRIAFLITSDEEGPATQGTVKVLEHLANRGEQIDWCIIGEPSASEKTGDTIKNGRRGSLGGHLIIQGSQGHIAYPHLAVNPIHKAAAAINEMTLECWDEGNRYFPATSFQISNIYGGTGAMNVIPGSLELDFNFRYSTQSNAAELSARIEQILNEHALDYELTWTSYGLPFLTEEGLLTQTAVSAVEAVMGYPAALSTSGGTSDGRFIAPTGAQVIELGPNNSTIHRVNERVSVEELLQLTQIYQQIISKLLI